MLHDFLVKTGRELVRTDKAFNSISQGVLSSWLKKYHWTYTSTTVNDAVPLAVAT